MIIKVEIDYQWKTLKDKILLQIKISHEKSCNYSSHYSHSSAHVILPESFYMGNAKSSSLRIFKKNKWFTLRFK